MRVSLGSALAGLVLAVTLAVAPPAPRAEEPPVVPGPITEWMAWYYVFPAPDRVGDFLAWLASEKLLTKRPAAAATTGAFLAPIFAAHPDRVRAWVDPQILDPTTRDSVIWALWLAGRVDIARDLFGTLPEMAAAPPPDLTRRRPTTPADVDAQWAAFMATGDAAHVRNVVDALDETIALTDDRTVEKKTRAAAAWSLGLNSLQHERVARLARAEAATRPPAVRKAIDTLLAEARRATKPFPVAEGEFSALVLVADIAALGEFAGRGDQTLNVTRAARAVRDQKIVVKALFMGQTLADDLTSDVTWDVVITDPTGKPWSGPDLIGLEGLKGRVPLRFRVFDSRGFPTLWFTDEDPAGVYTIRATVRDNLGRHALAFTETIEFVK